VLKPPMHPREQLKCFRNVSKNDNHKASGTEYLQKRPCCPFSAAQNHRTDKQDASRHECSQCFSQRVIHNVLVRDLTVEPQGIAINKPPLMPSDCSRPRPKLYSYPGSTYQPNLCFLECQNITSMMASALTEFGDFPYSFV